LFIHSDTNQHPVSLWNQILENQQRTRTGDYETISNPMREPFDNAWQLKYIDYLARISLASFNAIDGKKGSPSCLSIFFLVWDNDGNRP